MLKCEADLSICYLVQWRVVQKLPAAHFEFVNEECDPLFYEETVLHGSSRGGQQRHGVPSCTGSSGVELDGTNIDTKQFCNGLKPIFKIRRCGV